MPCLALNLRSSYLNLPSIWGYKCVPPCQVASFTLDSTVKILQDGNSALRDPDAGSELLCTRSHSGYLFLGYPGGFPVLSPRKSGVTAPRCPPHSLALRTADSYSWGPGPGWRPPNSTLFLAAAEESPVESVARALREVPQDGDGSSCPHIRLLSSPRPETGRWRQRDQADFPGDQVSRSAPPQV